MTKLWTPGERDQQWQLGYNNLYSIINDSSLIIMPLGDPRYFAGSGTFKTTGDIQATFTPSSDPRTWATPYNHTQDSSYTPGGLIPQLTFDGTNDEFDSPDADAWSFGDASNDSAFSIGFWVHLNASSHTGYVLTKFNAGVTREWVIGLTSGKIFVQINDQLNDNENITVTAASAISQWLFIIFTYDGTGGTSALDSPNAEVYVNAAIPAATRGGAGTYVAMHNTTAFVRIGGGDNFGTLTNPLNAHLAGASCCPWIVGKELTADEVNRIYRMQHSQIHGYYP